MSILEQINWQTYPPIFRRPYGYMINRNKNHSRTLVISSSPRCSLIPFLNESKSSVDLRETGNALHILPAENLNVFFPDDFTWG